MITIQDTHTISDETIVETEEIRYRTTKQRDKNKPLTDSSVKQCGEKNYYRERKNTKLVGRYSDEISRQTEPVQIRKLDKSKTVKN